MVAVQQILAGATALFERRADAEHPVDHLPCRNSSAATLPASWRRPECRHRYASHRAQLKAILLGWGMPRTTRRPPRTSCPGLICMAWTATGMSMILGYDRLRRNGRAKMDVRPTILKQTPVSVLVEMAGGGLGHVLAHFRHGRWRSTRRSTSGMAIAAVRNSAHFGATGYYTLMAAKAGPIGMGGTSASGIQVAPTFGKQAKLGTDPWSFAAPTADGRGRFCLIWRRRRWRR